MCDKADAGVEVQCPCWPLIMINLKDYDGGRFMRSNDCWCSKSKSKSRADLPNEEIASWSWVERMNWFVKKKKLEFIQILTSFSAIKNMPENVRREWPLCLGIIWIKILQIFFWFRFFIFLLKCLKICPDKIFCTP